MNLWLVWDAVPCVICKLPHERNDFIREAHAHALCGYRCPVAAFSSLEGSNNAGENKFKLQLSLQVPSFAYWRADSAVLLQSYGIRRAQNRDCRNLSIWCYARGAFAATASRLPISVSEGCLLNPDSEPDSEIYHSEGGALASKSRLITSA